MPDVFWSVPAEVYFGVDCALRVGGVAARFGKRVLVVTEAILYERGVIDQLTTLLSRKGLDPVVYDEVIPGATSSNADEAARLARGGRIDLVHANVPAHDYAGVKTGWTRYYWQPWKAYLRTSGRK